MVENKKELWRLFTAQDEYNPIITDKFNRCPYWLSKNRTIFHPTVSEYLLRNGLNPHYPDNKKFAICLTHDIDILFEIKTLNRCVKDAIKSLLSGNIQSLKKNLRATVSKEINPIWHISKLLNVEKKYNAKSSFYFLSLSKEEEDFNYDLSEIPELIDEILQNNGEIGLHGGHLAYNNISKIKQEKEKIESFIGKPVNGYRNHYLKFETPTTWELLDELKFKYDSTFGYADCAGFRNGMCYPFNPYNMKQNTFLDIVELPITIMDNSMSKYMNLNMPEQFKLCKYLIDIVEKHAGVLTFIWHNHLMDDMHGEFYEALLKYGYEKNAWITTANEIVDWWKENKYLEKSHTILQQLKYDAGEVPDET